MGDVLAEAAADNLIEDLVNNEDNESSHKDNPATGEKDKRNHEEETVTEGVRVRVAELDLKQILSLKIHERNVLFVDYQILLTS